ncbi:hypothetical protein TVAG_387020 [Trichomonas vaginalis G3]|uniref:BAR domain-containing protein n=1 Tax=Trichomonas vaginalis (strain ATCC PRA-98 / G3) TaxID=412133 RepID=A2GHZ5_TRIV3|nr:BAR/IMD domain-like family [Trichomonas vaginalis G3]EAX83222.1 hypothetical protein TVAG_387020 [Trichomonas vaginalis G3]KAI5546636.1 BAR/IMD domain-like family [Trichomonas vaginalis G3]|eukprot:XP_001296152.1 hypothetical protein [Trichomonas vaginalis G3]
MHRLYIDVTKKVTKPVISYYSQFKEINDVLNQLNQLRKKRHDVRLLTASLKGRVENHSKKGDPAEVAELRIRYENSNAELDILTKKFVTCVNNFWDNRHLIFEPIMEEMSKLTFNLCKDLYEPTQFMMMSVPRELLTTDFLKNDQEN